MRSDAVFAPCLEARKMPGFVSRSVSRGACWLTCLVTLAGPASAFTVQLEVRDEFGQITPARVSARDHSGRFFPAGPDTFYLSHREWPWMGEYFYPIDRVTMPMAAGNATFLVSKGFEYKPIRAQVNIDRDMTLIFSLSRRTDIRNEGWYSGDTHVHSNHHPSEFTITPEHLLKMAQAEGLNICWTLDNEHRFTGAPHPSSTPNEIIYYTVEYRNQAYGHAEMLGLKRITSTGCCTPPAQAFPLLSDFHDTWNPGYGEAFPLAHPYTGADFLDDEGGYPAWGLAREIPIQVTRGKLDAFDIASYGNESELALEWWYNILNLGYNIPPSAGTDCAFNVYWVRPPGGWRVYVREEGGPHNAERWVEALKAGRTFVTNFPLIPRFTVNGAEAGSTLEFPDSTTTVEVHFQVESALPVPRAELVRNGVVERTFSLNPGLNGTSAEFVTTVELHEPSWLALRVSGHTDMRMAISDTLFAHTGAVMVKLAGKGCSHTYDAGVMCDMADSLEMFVQNRGNWTSEGNRLYVLSRIAGAHDSLARHFHLPPGPCSLLAPADRDTVWPNDPDPFVWTAAVDPEVGDRVSYRVHLSPDSTFTTFFASPPLWTTEFRLMLLPYGAGRTYYWRVVSTDRGKHEGLCEPAWFSFWVPPSGGLADGLPVDGEIRGPGDGGGASAEGDHGAGAHGSVLVWPNPATGPVSLGWSRPDVQVGRFEIFDSSGRLVRLLFTDTAPPADGRGSPPLAVRQVGWDRLDNHGRRAGPGMYWSRYVTSSPAGVIRSPATGFILLQ